MESTENSEAEDFSRSIDVIAFEYGWTIDQIFDLTSDQLALFLEAGQQRRKDELIIQVGAMRLAVASVMSKEGQEAFERFMNDIRGSKIIQAKDVSKQDLSKMGMIIK